MNYCVYILHSGTLNKFYVGETENLEDRIKEHNDGYYKNSFTSSVSDWILYHSIDCVSRVQARKIETHIKKMKSSTYIRNIKEYPEIAEQLKLKYI